MLSISHLPLLSAVQYWVNICKDKYELATYCAGFVVYEIHRLKSCDMSQLFVKDILGYNLGTPVLKPHKQTTEPYHFDTVSQERPI